MNGLSINYQEEIKKFKNMEDIISGDDLIQRLLKDMIVNLLGDEMAEHLGGTEI